MKHISLLRGINVGGQRVIKMADLKALYQDLGLRDVVTYLQSGNVIFGTGPSAPVDMGTTIEQGILKKFGYQVPVVIRTHAELAEVLANSPYGEIDLAQDGAKYLVTFLSAAPDKSRMADLRPMVKAPEELVAAGRELYLHCPEGAGRSKLNHTLFEKKLAVAATTRNWRTLCKLIELSAAPVSGDHEST